MKRTSSLLVVLLFAIISLVGNVAEANWNDDLLAFNKALATHGGSYQRVNDIYLGAHQLFETTRMAYGNSRLPINALSNILNRTEHAEIGEVLRYVAEATLLFNQGTEEREIIRRFEDGGGLLGGIQTFYETMDRINQMPLSPSGMTGTQTVWTLPNAPQGGFSQGDDWMQARIAESTEWANQMREANRRAFQEASARYRAQFNSWTPEGTATYEAHVRDMQMLDQRKNEIEQRMRVWEQRWEILNEEVMRRSQVEF